MLVFGNRYYILKKAEKLKKDLFANFHYEYAFENNVTLDLNDFTNKASEDNFNNDIFNRILEVLNIKENNLKSRLPQKLSQNNTFGIIPKKRNFKNTKSLFLDF